MIKRDDTYDQHLKAMSDADLIAAYHRATGEPGDQDADGLLAEFQRRNLDL